LLRAFCLPAASVKIPPRIIPPAIALGALLVAACLPLISRNYPGNFLKALELDTYDWRMRRAAQGSNQAATNLAAIYLDEASIQDLAATLRVHWPYPRQVHGRIVRELHRQGARAVAFDILFEGLRPMDAPVEREDKSLPLEESDDFFARQLEAAGNTYLARGEEAVPSPKFAQAARGVGSLITHKDSDGVLRRIKPVEVDDQGNPIWHLGVLLAAHDLDLDLNAAEISKSFVDIPDRAGHRHILPLDDAGLMLIDWNLAWNDPRILKLNFGMVARMDLVRELFGEEGHRELLDAYRESDRPDLAGYAPLAGRLCIIGSVAEGNNVTDFGATPLSRHEPLVSTYHNVANTILMNRFIRPVGVTGEIALLMLLGLTASWLTWRTRVKWGSLWILALGLGFVMAAVAAFTYQRVWIPVVNPVLGGLLLPYLALVSYRVVFEEREQRRIKQVFKRVVSPNVVNELLAAERLSLGGARRNISVFFADVRGFTEMTDSTQARAEKYVADHQLAPEAAENYFDESARAVLATVNLYLGTIADIIKKHDGTLDKYIGDCVMAFWGAPIANEQHAVACVRAAIESQRAIYRLNQDRAAENARRKAAAQPADDLQLLPLLTLGTGINSGIATVGLMGSEEHTFSYTIFGREVNLASRLETFSGRGRIIIGGNTYADLQRFAPDLAATCIRQAPQSFKGFREEIVTYEVPWREPAPAVT
jgi:class 3 adenylate cyclase/CHASE2 domain-containing sensor protein